MKRRTKQNMILGLLGVAVLGGLAAPILKQAYDTERAAAAMAAFSDSDWRSLYDQGISLYDTLKPDNIAINRRLWPPAIAKLRPVYVWVTDKYILLVWSKASSRFLRIEIVRQSWDDGAHWPRYRGFFVADTAEEIPRYPWLVDKKERDGQPAGGAYVSPAAGDPSAHP